MAEIMHKKYEKPKIIEEIKKPKTVEEIIELTSKLKKYSLQTQKKIIEELSFKVNFKEILMQLTNEKFSELMKSKQMKTNFFLFINKEFSNLNEKEKLQAINLLKNLKYDSIQVLQNIMQREQNEEIKKKAFKALEEVAKNHPNESLIIKTAERKLKK